MSINAIIQYGDLPFVLEDSEEIEDGPLGELDNGSLEILATDADWVGDAAALGYTKGSSIPGSTTMFVESLRRRRSGSVATVSVQIVGLFTGDEKRLRRTSCAGQQISVGPVEKVILVWDAGEQARDPINPSSTSIVAKRRVPKVNDDGEVQYQSIATPSGFFDRWNIHQAILNVEDTYFTTIRPPDNVGGTANTPPDAPTPPPYIWGGFSGDMRGQHPNGWVIEDRQITDLFPGLYAVTDRWGYYYAALPD